MKLLVIAIATLSILSACAKKEPAMLTISEFSGKKSVMAAAHRVFPESSEIVLKDFWTSADGTHEFVVVFTGREFKGGFERMYWRYLTFAKQKSESDWSAARVFDVPDNRFGPFDKSLAWLEQNAKELKAPNQSLDPMSGLAPGHGSS